MCNNKNSGHNEVNSGDPNPLPDPIPDFAPNFGVLLNGDFTAVEKADISFDTLSCQHARTAVKLNTWDGTDNVIDAYEAKGLQVMLNLNRGQSPYPFVANPTEMTAYKALLNSVLDIYVPEVAVCENEEFNTGYHTGNVTTQYCPMLHEFALICQSRGIKCTNGGMTGVGIEILAYRDLVSIGRQADADFFGDNCMTPRSIKAAKDPVKFPQYEAHVLDVQAVLAVVASDCDYCNLHYYETQKETLTSSQQIAQSSVTPKILQVLISYIFKVTGKKCITNETGQRNNFKPSMVTSMLQEYTNLQVEYVTWFSGGAESDATGLVDSSGNILDTGVAFEAFVNP